MCVAGADNIGSSQQDTYTGNGGIRVLAGRIRGIVGPPHCFAAKVSGKGDVILGYSPPPAGDIRTGQPARYLPLLYPCCLADRRPPLPNKIRKVTKTDSLMGPGALAGGGCVWAVCALFARAGWSRSPVWGWGCFGNCWAGDGSCASSAGSKYRRRVRTFVPSSYGSASI